MRTVRKRIISTVLMAMMMVSPALTGSNVSKAVVIEAIEGAVEGTETAMILAECIEILTNLEVNTKKLEGAKEYVTGLQDAFYAVKSLEEIKSLAQEVVDFANYAEANFGDGFKSSMDVSNMGARLLKRLSEEYKGTMKLIQGTEDPAGAASILQNFWSKVQAVRETFHKAAGKFVKENNPAESQPNAQIMGAGLMAPGGFFNAFSYDEQKKGFLSSKPKGFGQNRNLKEALAVNSKPKAVKRDVNTVKADAEEAAAGLVRYKNSFANIVKVIIGLFLLIYTVINLIKYFGGTGGSQDGVGPLARVFIALVVCLVTLGILDKMV